MDKDFEILYNRAKEITGKKELNQSVSYAHVGCATTAYMATIIKNYIAEREV